MPLPPSQKLKFERERGRIQPYADVYRFGGASTGAPLVLYIGGAIGREDYVARSSTPPDPIAAEFQRAFEVVAPGRLRFSCVPARSTSAATTVSSTTSIRGWRRASAARMRFRASDTP